MLWRLRPTPSNKLTDAEADSGLSVLRSPRFCDRLPAQAYFTLLDEGTYLAAESTFYRPLREHGEVRERRVQATHPPKKSRSLPPRRRTSTDNETSPSTAGSAVRILRLSLPEAPAAPV